MLFARIVLSIQIAALLVLGLAYFIRPEEMTSLSGALLMGNAAVTEVRAYSIFDFFAENERFLMF